MKNFNQLILQFISVLKGQSVILLLISDKKKIKI